MYFRNAVFSNKILLWKKKFISSAVHCFIISWAFLTIISIRIKFFFVISTLHQSERSWDIKFWLFKINYFKPFTPWWLGIKLCPLFVHTIWVFFGKPSLWPPMFLPLPYPFPCPQTFLGPTGLQRQTDYTFTTQQNKECYKNAQL